ncbi:ATP-binding protein [Nonomuraea sp. NPDC050556]|uniref:ATP-binding protein n=1 Tax=Nonomuraea sp. NPDC050556 TaxID=3364369 RepID=UPI00378FFE87
MFVGRDQELEALAAAPAATLVYGEPGIGKSRLVKEHVATLDALVAVGGADPGSLPYAPFVAAMRRLPGVRPELSNPGADRARLFEEVLVFLERAGAERPIVLVLEDLHWADQSSLDLLTFLLRNLMSENVRLICTSRESPHLWPLTRIGDVTLVKPRPLGRDDVAAMVAGACDVDQVLARSEGNPLFVEALVDAGTFGSLREVLLAGAERLAPVALDVLRVAAVGGRRVEHRLLCDLAGLDELALDDALRPLVRGRFLLVDGDGYTFRHTMIREAVYGDLLPGERIRLHRRYAEALADRPSMAADHWYEAGDRPRAFESAWQARRYERVLELWEPSSGVEHATVLELAARHALHAGEARRAEELATAALAEVEDPARTATLLELRVAIRDQLGEDGLDDLRRAVRLAPDTPRLLGALAATLYWNGMETEARAHAEKAAALGDTRSLITLAALTQDLDEAAGLYDRARRQAADHDTLLVAEASEADVLEAAGEHARAEAVARRGIAQARRMGLARSRGTLLAANLAEPLASLGRWKEAHEVVTEALALDPPPIYRAWLLLVRGTVAVWQGDLDTAADVVAEARPLMLGTSRGYDSCLEPDLLEANYAQAAGDHERARRVVDHALSSHDLTRTRRYAWPILVLAARFSGVRQAPPGLVTAGRLQQAHRSTFDAECGAPWEPAVAAWRAVGQPYMLGRVLLRGAERALAEGDRQVAEPWLRESAAVATELGAGPLLKDVEAVAATGRMALTAGSGLTARELEVLRLVSEGLSNKQIAERLFISSRTSGVHVSNILAKLGASSRIEAAALARREGLI